MEWAKARFEAILANPKSGREKPSTKHYATNRQEQRDEEASLEEEEASRKETEKVPKEDDLGKVPTTTAEKERENEREVNVEESEKVLTASEIEKISEKESSKEETAALSSPSISVSMITSPALASQAPLYTAYASVSDTSYASYTAYADCLDEDASYPLPLYSEPKYQVYAEDLETSAPIVPRTNPLLVPLFRFLSLIPLPTLTIQ